MSELCKTFLARLLQGHFNKLVIFYESYIKMSPSYVNKNWHDSCNSKKVGLYDICCRFCGWSYVKHFWHDSCKAKNFKKVT